MSNTEWVKERILSEYEKYKDSEVDWAEMAANKILSTIKHSYDTIFQESLNELDYYDGARFGVSKLHYNVMNWLEDED